jgi:ADP-heptose:LPS heptosyltransferase
VTSNKSFKALLLKFLTRKKFNEFSIENTESILFFRYDRIGDMIISTPVFRELKLSYPNIKISILASQVNQNILQSNPYIDEIFINSKQNIFKDLVILLKLRRRQFDACIEFDHSVIPHAILRLKIIKPKVVISVAKKGRYGVCGNDLKLYDYFTKKENHAHFRDIWLETLSPFSIKPKSNHYDLFCNDHQQRIAQNFITNFGNKILIGINLEGSVEGKKIKITDLKILCKGLYQKYNDIQIVILSAPYNYQKLKKEIDRIKLDYLVLSYKTEKIMDVAALIEKLDLIITPDTSIAHIASTFNKPVVTIHENNVDSYELFAPTSHLNRTVFSMSRKSLSGFSLNQLLRHCYDLIDQVKKESYEQ